MTLPLVARVPALAALPRAPLGVFPSPVAPVPSAEDLWLKRDDLDAPVVGGNKVRALEWLLGGTGPGDTVLTVGGEGSTHVLATAVHARRLGARTIAVRWPHAMNPVAERVRHAAEREATILRARTVPTALLRAWWIRHTRAVRWVPLGGSTPLGVLGHVNAALELVAQVEAGLLPLPARVVLPLGSGGTAAGLALGFAIAGVPVTVVGARVGPRLLVTRRHALALAEATRRLIARHGGRAPAVRPERLVVEHRAYAGAYGRAHPDGAAAAAWVAPGIALDATYAEKAAVAARHALAGAGPTLFWVTFDGRWLDAA